MARDHDSARGSRLGDRDVQVRIRSAANRLIATLLGADDAVERLVARVPADDQGFADRLIRRELGMIADGMDPLRVSFRIALLVAGRDALQCCREIRALPEIASTPDGRLTRDG